MVFNSLNALHFWWPFKRLFFYYFFQMRKSKCNKKATLALLYKYNVDDDDGVHCTHQANNIKSIFMEWYTIYKTFLCYTHANQPTSPSSCCCLFNSYRSLLLKYCLGFTHSSTIEINCSASSVFCYMYGWCWHQTNKHTHIKGYLIIRVIVSF